MHLAGFTSICKITVCGVTCIQDGLCILCILSVARHISNAAVLRKFACSEIEGVRKRLQADDQFEEPTAVTNYVIVNAKLTDTVTNRQSNSFFSIYGKEPHRVLRVGSRATCGQIEISGIPNSLNYCVIL